MTTALVLRRALAMLAAAGEQPSSTARVSITVMARVLGDVTLVIASCHQIPLRDVTESVPRVFDMDTHPIRLDTLSGDPRVVIRADGIDLPADLSLRVHLEATALTSDSTAALLHDFGELTLTAQAPMVNLQLPLGHLRASSNDR
ncbi:hypothetical protein ACK280_19685 [Mycobacterium sherrisii]|uniref:hypothetical protein n=1 Tax=Mycobacterium sherrisii TaxID=243061 RepID=UPI0039757C8D